MMVPKKYRKIETSVMGMSTLGGESFNGVSNRGFGVSTPLSGNQVLFRVYIWNKNKRNITCLCFFQTSDAPSAEIVVVGGGRGESFLHCSSQMENGGRL